MLLEEVSDQGLFVSSSANYYMDNLGWLNAGDQPEDPILEIQHLSQMCSDSFNMQAQLYLVASMHLCLSSMHKQLSGGARGLHFVPSLQLLSILECACSEVPWVILDISAIE